MSKFKLQFNVKIVYARHLRALLFAYSVGHRVDEGVDLSQRHMVPLLL